MDFEPIKHKILEVLARNGSVEQKLFTICKLLSESVDYYNWVGFYFRNGDKEELILGPYFGEKTEHTIIPFGKGICGQVAVSNKNFVVPDVSRQSNYLSCSNSVKSEIVIPVFVDGKNIGQIDIDSHYIDPFSKEDENFLEFINDEIAKIIY
jgi:L-methionine (R)-S-oxide reductase